MTADLYPTPTRRRLAIAINGGDVRWFHRVTEEAWWESMDRRVTAEVRELVREGLALIPAGDAGGTSVVELTDAGRAWLADAERAS